MAIASRLVWVAGALALASGFMSSAVAQGTKEPSNPIVQFPTSTQPLPSNTTPPTPNVYGNVYGPSVGAVAGVPRFRRAYPVRRH